MKCVRHSVECFFSTTPIGWHWKLGCGGEKKGPATLPNDIYLLKFVEITPGCWEVEIKLLDTRNF